MPSSGSTDYTNTRAEIITAALDLVGLTSEDQTPAPYLTSQANGFLNRMVKAWNAQGHHLWCRTEGTLFLSSAGQSYSLGPTGDHATESYVSSTLSAAEASGQTILSITSTAGMTANDNIGIELDDGTLQWTTITTVDSSVQVTVAAALTGDAASGNTVYAYTTKLERPLRITSARYVQSDGNEYPIELISREEYMDQSNKSSTGKASMVHYSPQLTNGVLYVWPTADSVDDLIKFTFERSLEDLDAVSNNADFPQEWLEALILNLAIRLPAFYRLPPNEQGILKNDAAMALDNVLSFDSDPTPAFFQVDFQR